MRQNPTEIHIVLSEVCSEFTMDRSTFSRCANRFRGGSMSTDNDPRPGRPRTTTDERSVKLVADDLEEDRLTTFEELSRATGVKTCQDNAQKPTSVARGWSSHSPRQCSPTHRGCCSRKLLNYAWELLLHAPYSPHMSPPDFGLFPKLKEPMRGRRFSSLEEFSTYSTRAI